MCHPTGALCEHPSHLCEHDGLLQYEALHHPKDHSSMCFIKRNTCECLITLLV